MSAVYVSEILVAIWSLVWIGLAADASGKWLDSPYEEVSNEAGLAWNSAQDKLYTRADFGVGLFFIFGITQIFWSYKGCKVSEKEGSAKRKWGRWWSIGGWVMPIGFFFIPLLVIRESELLLNKSRKKNSCLG